MTGTVIAGLTKNECLCTDIKTTPKTTNDGKLFEHFCLK